jgi:RHS repeat-associated protein
MQACRKDTNQNNRLVRVETGGTVLAEYAYDGFERRVKKVAGGVTTHYHYDLNGRLIAETAGAGNPIRDYVHIDGEPVAMQVYGAGAGWYWFLNDHLGTPQKLVDNAGAVVWQAAYMPFGEARVLTADIENNLRFPGQYFDAESGLHYNWHRYYDPETGRYLRPDPIGLAGGINLFAYVQNDPVNWIDIEGLQGDINLGKGWSARVDTFNTSMGSSHEIHVWNANQEVGVFGPRGWINKHGFKGAPQNLPREIFNKVNGINVDIMRRQGIIPPKGQMNIKGGRYLRGMGSVGVLIMLMEAYETQQRAEECGKDFWEQSIEDMVGPIQLPSN